MQRVYASEKINVPHSTYHMGREVCAICPHCIITIILIPSPTGASYKSIRLAHIMLQKGLIVGVCTGT